MPRYRFLLPGLLATALAWIAGSELLAQDRARIERDRPAANGSTRDVTDAPDTYSGRIVRVDRANRLIVLSTVTGVEWTTRPRADQPLPEDIPVPPGFGGIPGPASTSRLPDIPRGTGGIPGFGTITGQPPTPGNGSTTDPRIAGNGAPGSEVERRRPGADGPGFGTTRGTGAPGSEVERRRPGADAPPARGGWDRLTGQTAGPSVTVRVANTSRITLDGQEISILSLRTGLFVRVHIRTDSTEGATRELSTTGGSRNRSATEDLVADRIEAFSRAPAYRGSTGERDRPGDGGRPGYGSRPGNAGPRN